MIPAVPFSLRLLFGVLLMLIANAFAKAANWILPEMAKAAREAEE